MIDLARLDSCALECDFSCRGPNLGRDAQPRVIGLGEGVERDVFLDRQRKMTAGNSARSEFCRSAASPTSAAPISRAVAPSVVPD
jgi:hypothetical protein